MRIKITLMAVTVVLLSGAASYGNDIAMPSASSRLVSYADSELNESQGYRRMQTRLGDLTARHRRDIAEILQGDLYFPVQNQLIDRAKTEARLRDATAKNMYNNCIVAFTNSQWNNEFARRLRGVEQELSQLERELRQDKINKSMLQIARERPGVDLPSLEHFLENRRRFYGDICRIILQGALNARDLNDQFLIFTRLPIVESRIALLDLDLGLAIATLRKLTLENTQVVLNMTLQEIENYLRTDLSDVLNFAHINVNHPRHNQIFAGNDRFDLMNQSLQETYGKLYTPVDLRSYCQISRGLSLINTNSSSLLSNLLTPSGVTIANQIRQRINSIPLVRDVFRRQFGSDLNTMFILGIRGTLEQDGVNTQRMTANANSIFPRCS